MSLRLGQEVQALPWRLRVRAPSDEQDGAFVAAENPVGGHQRESFVDRLRKQHPVEGVAVPRFLCLQGNRLCRGYGEFNVVVRIGCR